MRHQVCVGSSYALNEARHGAFESTSNRAVGGGRQGQRLEGNGGSKEATCWEDVTRQIEDYCRNTGHKQPEPIRPQLRSTMEPHLQVALNRPGE